MLLKDELFGHVELSQFDSTHAAIREFQQPRRPTADKTSLKNCAMMTILLSLLFFLHSTLLPNYVKTGLVGGPYK